MTCSSDCAVTPEVLVPDWRAPPGVRALFSTRTLGDMSGSGKGRESLRAMLPSEPQWLRQVHGAAVARLDRVPQAGAVPQADAAVTRARGVVCAVLVADCMPVLLASEAGDAIGLAHAGWRGLAAGVVEAALEAMAVDPRRVRAWLGPAIGPRAYEVGDEVRAVFLENCTGAQSAFRATRPGHWLLDLYAIARSRLAQAGVVQVSGGTHCTYSDPVRFYSFRRDGARERMAALAWLE